MGVVCILLVTAVSVITLKLYDYFAIYLILISFFMGVLATWIDDYNDQTKGGIEDGKEEKD